MIKLSDTGGDFERLKKLHPCLISLATICLRKTQILDFDHNEMTIKVPLNRYLQKDYSDSELYFCLLDSQGRPTVFHKVLETAYNYDTIDHES